MLLALSLIVAFSTAALGVELGVSQEMAGTNYLRFDAGNFLFEVPMESDIDSVSAGAAIPTEFWDSYALGLMEFEKKTEGKLGFGDVTLGVGYPIEFGNFTLRGELRASNPQWTKLHKWKFTPLLSIQFSFAALRPDPG